MKEKNRSRSGAAGTPSGVAYLLGRAHHALVRRLRDTLTPLGLTVAQYTALSFLARESLSNAQLAVRAMVSPQAANEMVKVMEERDLITREPDPSHGRIIRIALTPMGKALLAQGDRGVAELEAVMLSGYSDTQKAALRDELRQVLHALSAPDA